VLLEAEAILTVCREIGYTAWRDRVLTPVTTIHLFLLQILHGNTACSHLPHLSSLRFSAAAYCQARARLPLRCFDLLLERFGSAVQRSALDDGRWHGHRTFLVDGSGCSMPDTPTLQDAFGQPSGQRPGCGFPMARLLGLFHASTGVLLKLIVTPLLTHDLAQVHKVHPMLAPGDVLVADRGLCSYAHLALLMHAGGRAIAGGRRQKGDLARAEESAQLMLECLRQRAEAGSVQVQDQGDPRRGALGHNGSGEGARQEAAAKHRAAPRRVPQVT
jgi:hypothetical protein